MKKAITLFAALTLLVSASFAQSNARRMTQKDMAAMSPATMFKAQQHKVAPKTTTATKDAVTISTFPWTEGFESGSTPAGFTFIDADNDGYTWEVFDFEEIGNGHNGSDYVVTSASYINNIGVLTPDDWMILPTFALPSDASNYELTWYEKGQDVEYADEYYSVYISTTGRTVAAFGNTPVLSSTTTGVWVKKSINLGSYAGQTINIAFRHYNSTDMYYLDIDDIRVGGPEAPELSIEGPSVALMNQAVTYTATSSVNTLTWYVDGTTVNTTGLTLTHTFTTDGTHQVVAQATNTVGSTYDTIDVNVVDCGNAIAEFPYTENFEDVNPCWQFISADPANDARTGITTAQAHQGSSSFALSSYNRASDYNQFLISPEISLPTDTQYMVKFWYKGYNEADAFRVKVSTTTADIAAFTTVLADLSTVNTEWTEVAYILPAGTKYIAINYYGYFKYYLYIDEFVIDELTAPDVHIEGPLTIGTGMQATYTAIANLADSYEWYIDGTNANTTGNVLNNIFTTADTHEVVVVATNTVGSNSDTLYVDVFSCDDITIPYAPDFTTTLGCWSNRSDSTESGWFLSTETFEEGHVVGQVLSISAQSIWGFMMDIPHDNWLTSPLITMPAEGNYEVAWKVKPYDTSIPYDHYGVYLIQGTTTTLLFEETLNSSMTDFVQRTASIPASVDGQFQVAFRHFNSEGGYVIILDSIQFRALTAPIVSLEGPAGVEVDNAATFTAVCGSASSYAWTVDGNAVNESSNVLTHTFTTAGNHTVAVTATNAVSNATATLTVEAINCAGTSLPYDEGFEGISANCWQMSNGFGLVNDPEYTNNGNGAMFCTYDDYAALDEWAISPAITMPADASNIGISWYVWMREYEGILNTYELRVSTTGRNVADFNTLLFRETGAADDYLQRGWNLANFAGQTIYIAFHNISAAGGDAIFFDDIHIGTGVGIEDVNTVNVAVYPNPANDVLNINGEGIQQVNLIDINGRTVMSAAKAGSLNISSLATGVYMVRVITTTGVSTQKIVKK